MAALDHIFAPVAARNNESGQVATAEAKRAERHYEDLQEQLAHRSSSQSVTMRSCGVCDNSTV